MIVVEDGTGVSGANSYVDEDAAALRSAALGVDFPSTADATTPLIKAGIFLEKYRNQYQGKKYITGQSLQWPRDPVYIDDEYSDPNIIPQLLIDAQIVIAAADYDGATLFATSAGSAISKSEGDVSVTKSNAGKMDNTSVMGLADQLLAPLMKSAGNGLFEFDVCRG
ncbi:MAG: hypothetical protein Unbinned3818contig1000_46 [Prokaryotic dsDNA virus sp.]|nr:hypothetical protein [Phycisphaerae bacterium]QDP45975.1 MAG: hypothetical protein Unbinned3818contig1000_46 [Prokaryotic dsDNA virus sp.]|tara:strand:+ start:260 stop:760 length:501 start_codon:yes stop_codon:yes gene_type:complete